MLYLLCLDISISILITSNLFGRCSLGNVLKFSTSPMWCGKLFHISERCGISGEFSIPSIRCCKFSTFSISYMISAVKRVTGEISAHCGCCAVCQHVQQTTKSPLLPCRYMLIFFKQFKLTIDSSIYKVYTILNSVLILLDKTLILYN